MIKSFEFILIMIIPYNLYPSCQFLYVTIPYQTLGVVLQVPGPGVVWLIPTKTLPIVKGRGLHDAFLRRFSWERELGEAGEAKWQSLQRYAKVNVEICWDLDCEDRDL